MVVKFTKVQKIVFFNEFNLYFYVHLVKLMIVKMCQFVIVVDDESGEVEGNLVMGASFASAEAIAFMVRYGSGIISVGMKEEDLERLELPLMSPEKEDDSSAPSFTITVVI